MSEHITVTDAARHFASYLNRVVYRGERFVLFRGNKPVAELRPPTIGKSLAELPALLASLPRLTELEAADLGADIESDRKMLSGTELKNPWAS